MDACAVNSALGQEYRQSLGYKRYPKPLSIVCMRSEVPSVNFEGLVYLDRIRAMIMASRNPILKKTLTRLWPRSSHGCVSAIDAKVPVARERRVPIERSVLI